MDRGGEVAFRGGGACESAAGEHRHTVPSPSPPAMEALVATSLGDPAIVVRHEAAHPRPALGRGAVRVAVAAASLNFADLLQVG